MLKALLTVAFTAVSSLALACGMHENAEIDPTLETAALDGATLDETQRAAYDQCLQDNMAVAMAWSMIEQQCLEQVSDGGAQLQ